MSPVQMTPTAVQSKFARRNFTRLLAIFALSFALPTGSTRAADDGGIRNTVILIIRHAEKPAEASEDKKTKEDLAPKGFERAGRYVGYFQGYTIGDKPLALGAIIAAANSDSSHRPKQTVHLTSELMPGVPFDDSVADADYQTVVDRFNKGTYNGKNVLICWHHGKIPELLTALGVKNNYFASEPKQAWPADVFCWLFQLSYDKDGKLSVETKNVMLMPGDDKYPPPTPGK